MASMLSRVTKGVQRAPHRIVLYGPDGIGKTTFGASAPNPIFLECEGGSRNFDVTRLPNVTKFADVLQGIEELTTEKHDFKTLVVDSLDWLEKILHRDICLQGKPVSSIEQAAGGYGKGYIIAFNWFDKMLKQIDEMVIKRNMNVILIGHADIATFHDPALQESYERYHLKLHKKSSALFREWADCVLFTNFEIFTTSEEGTKRTRAHGDGARLVYTERRPGFDAKNRYGLPFTFPFGYEDYERAVEQAVPDPKKFQSQIEHMLSEVQDEELRKKIQETTKTAGNNVLKLQAIINRIRVRLEEQTL